MLYLYIVISAALIPIIDRFAPIFQKSYSWWLVPLMIVGFFIGFILLHLIVFAVSVLIVNPNKESDKGNKYYRALVNVTLPLIFKIVGVRIHVTGEDKIPYDKRVMLICNHISDIDPAVIISSFPQLELGFIAKKEAYTLFPFIGKVMKKLNCLPIDRENNREGIKTILKAVKYIKEDKVSIGIFPEGYTSLTGELQDFRNGAFKIATKANAPIVVCTLVNSDKALKNLFRRTDIYLDVLDVISEEDVNSLHTDKIGERAHKIMLENIKKRKEQKTAAS